MLSTFAKVYDKPKLSCMFIAFLSAICWSFFDLMSGLVRNTEGSLITIAMGVALASTGCVGVIPIRHSVEAQMIPKALVCGAVVTLDIALYIFAIKYCPVGDVVLLFALNLLWTSIMDSIYRRIWPTKWQLVSIVLAFIGMNLVVQPSFIFRHILDAKIEKVRSSSSLTALHGQEIYGHLMALLSGFFYSIGAIMVSAFGALDWTIWVSFQGILVVLLGLILTAFLPAGQLLAGVTATVAFIIFLICVFEVVGRASVVIACQISPTLCVIVGCAQIPMTYTWSAIWLDEMLDGLRAFGVLCIMVALAVILYSTAKLKEAKEKEEQEEEDDEMKVLGKFQ